MIEIMGAFDKSVFLGRYCDSPEACNQYKVGFSCRQRSVIYTKAQMSYLFPCRIPSASAILTRSANERAPIFRMTLPR